MADAEIEHMRKRMTNAAQMDAINRQEGKPAMHKLKLLPEVIMLLNRNQYTSSLVDPEINLLEAVRFFLEPLDDGSMPAYNIQRDLLTAMTKLPIQKDALIASGIGKVVVFYTKSKRTERRIKDMAEKLLAEWTRPILQRSDDYSKRVFREAVFDPTYVASFLHRYACCSLLTLAQKNDQDYPDQRRGRCSRSPRSRDASTPSGQPCSCRPYPSQLRRCSSTDRCPGESVRAAPGSQRRGPIPQDASPAKRGAEGVPAVIWKTFLYFSSFHFISFLLGDYARHHLLESYFFSFMMRLAFGIDRDH